MCLCLVTVMENQCFLIFKWSFLSQFLTTGSGPCSALFAIAPHHTCRYLYTFDEISSVYPLFKTEQARLSQVYLWGIFQSLDHFCSPLLGSLWYIHISLDLRTPELGSAVRVWCHHSWVAGKDLDLLATLKKVGGKRE